MGGGGKERGADGREGKRARGRDRGMVMPRCRF
jgi:hypothetical protein